MSHLFRPRHWLLYVALAGMLVLAVHMLLFAIDPITEWLSVIGAIIITVMATIATIAMIAAIAIYAIQWLVTLVAMWKPPQTAS